MFNDADKADSTALQGYTYTIQRYENGGLYFTRANEDATDTKLYFVTEDRASEWNSVKANDFVNNADVDVVANDTTNASASALYEVEEKGRRARIFCQRGNRLQIRGFDQRQKDLFLRGHVQGL